MVLGGPLPHVLAAKAVAFGEAGTDGFKAYASRITENASALAVLTGGTDNHLRIRHVRPDHPGHGKS